MAGRTNSIDGLSYSSNNLFGGDNLVVYVGPAQFNLPNASAWLTFPDPGGDDSNTRCKLVGVIQQLSVQSGRPQRQINEIGSNAKYLVSSRGQKQMTIARIVTTHGNVLYAMYRSLLEWGNNPAIGPAGKIWLTLSHPICRRPVGLAFVAGSYDESNTWIPREIKYHENVVVSSIGTQITEGDVGIADNLSLTWSNTIKIPVS